MPSAGLSRAAPHEAPIVADRIHPRAHPASAPEVVARLLPGHWEDDTLQSKFNRSAVGTLVEPSTLFVLLTRTNGTIAEATGDGFSRVLDRAGRSTNSASPAIAGGGR